MELREYLAIRRAYNLVRQEMPANRRLTFVELAILCRLDILGCSMNTSEIAEYQGALRPTMTHRTKHLAELGLIVRAKGNSDRRNVTCQITDAGKAFVSEVCLGVCEVLHAGTVLTRTVPRRVCRYINAMGALACMSGELVLLEILQSGEAGRTVSDLVSSLGLLQPTVSMSVASLTEEGCVRRKHSDEVGARLASIVLTDKGKQRAEELAEQIAHVVVRRKS